MTSGSVRKVQSEICIGHPSPDNQLSFLQCSCSIVQNQEPKIEIYIPSFPILIEISNLIYLFSFCFSRYPACFLCHHQLDVVHPDYFHFHRLSNLFHFQRLCQVLICLQQLSWSPRSQSLVQVGELHLGKANWLHLLWPTKKLNSNQRQLQQVSYTKTFPQRATNNLEIKINQFYEKCFLISSIKTLFTTIENIKKGKFRVIYTNISFHKFFFWPEDFSNHLVYNVFALKFILVLGPVPQVVFSMVIQIQIFCY